MITTHATKTVFIHDSDFSGDVTIKEKYTGKQMTVPFDDLKALVASWVRDEKVGRLENAEDDDILLNL